MLSDRVDSDFASDIESRKSVTGYLLSPNGGLISWNVARQGDVTLSCSKAEFVAASQTGKEVLYLYALLKGFACTRPSAWALGGQCLMHSHERES